MSFTTDQLVQVGGLIAALLAGVGITPLAKSFFARYKATIDATGAAEAKRIENDAQQRFDAAAAWWKECKDIKEDFRKLNAVVTALASERDSLKARLEAMQIQLDLQASILSGRPTISGTELTVAMRDSMTLEDIQLMCADLAVDYEDLPGDTKTAKALALTDVMRRLNRKSELRAAIIAARPGIKI